MPDTRQDDLSLREGTIKRTQSAKASAQLESVTPQPHHAEPTVIWASGYGLGRFDLAVDCNFDGSDTWLPCRLSSSGLGLAFGDPSIDLNDADLVVEWDR